VKGEPLLPNDWHNDPWDDIDAVSDASVEEVKSGWDSVRSPVRMLVFVLVGVVLLLGASGWWVIYQLNPSGEPGVAINFTVNNGDTVDVVSNRLADLGVIENPRLFRWYVSTRGGLELIPGYYSLRPKDNAGKIIESLSTPPAQTFVSVTFPEGMTITQMAERLALKMTFMSVDDFMQAATDGSVASDILPKGTMTLEGLLFPDTYQVSGDDTEARVVGRLSDMMQRVSRQVDLVAGAKTRGVTPYQILVIASMIEREAKVGEDRSKIAQVIYNRLAAKMALEIDATVKYGQDPSMTWTQMKETDTPYNSYLNKGLPPTPIANPGRASIEAALAPAGAPPKNDEACVGLDAVTKCQYLYYVLDDANGGHVFAATYDQHLINIEKSRVAGLLP
jgi:UPF0755 protein